MLLKFFDVKVLEKQVKLKIVFLKIVTLNTFLTPRQILPSTIKRISCNNLPSNAFYKNDMNSQPKSVKLKKK